MIGVFVQGLGLGAGLIIAIGSQNAFVLRQGLKRQHHLAIATLCAFIDMALIAVGGLGVGTMIATSPQLADGATVFGALFVGAYGVLALRRALKGEHMATSDSQASGQSLAAAVATALGFSLLNPHVYLDTVVLLGSISGQYAWGVRVWFLAGAMTASVVWFYALALAAAKLAPLFRKPGTWKALDFAIATIMFWIAASLIVGRFF